MSRSTQMKCVTIMGLAVGLAITAATSSKPDAPNGPRIGGDLALEVNTVYRSGNNGQRTDAAQ